MYYPAKDLRYGRYSQFGRPYLITTVTENRDPIFQNFNIARLMIHELHACCDQLHIESLAWGSDAGSFALAVSVESFTAF